MNDEDLNQYYITILDNHDELISIVLMNILEDQLIINKRTKQGETNICEPIDE